MKNLNDNPRTISTKDIALGKRYRHDLGNIVELGRSINEVGLLHPIVIRTDGTLIAGARRLAACKHLGWQEIPVTVVDLEEIVRGEFAENAYRKAFLPSEIHAITREIEPLEKAAAQERQKATQFGSHGGGNFPSPNGAKGKSRDRMARLVGISGRTLDKISVVMEAAEKDPEQFEKLKDAMDRTGRVSSPYKRLQAILKADAIKKEPPPLPSKGPYRVIGVDAPWPYRKRGRGTYPYPSMTIEQICAVPVPSIAHTDCILWLWTTNSHMREAFAVLDAWGFQQKTILTWVKNKMGTGDWLRGQTEHCLMAVRGKPIVNLTNQTTVLHAPVRAHSQKPDEFYELVERLCPAPRYASLFHRGVTRPKWDGHGDEICGSVVPEVGE